MDKLEDIAGYRIKVARQQELMTQAELAQALGYKSPATVAKWELGANVVPLNHIQEIAALLNVSAQWLLGMDQEAPADGSERERELEEACEMHLETITGLKQQLTDVSTGHCYSSACQLRAGHEGTHYDGDRRYYSVEAETS